MRAGSSVDLVVAETGWPVDKVLRYAEPVLGERAFVAQQAQAAEVRRSGGPLTLDESVRAVLGLDDDPVAEWDAYRRDDGRWVVQVTISGAKAQWTYDQVGRTVHPLDDTARAWMGVAPVSDPIEDALGLIADTAVVRADAEVETIEEAAVTERPRLVAVPSLDDDSQVEELPASEPVQFEEVVEYVETLEYDEVIETSDATILRHTAETIVVEVDQATFESAGMAIESTSQSGRAADEKPEQARTEQRPKAVKAKSRRGRASVPSWDEILFGATKGDDQP